MSSTIDKESLKEFFSVTVAVPSKGKSFSERASRLMNTAHDFRHGLDRDGNQWVVICHYTKEEFRFKTLGGVETYLEALEVLREFHLLAGQDGLEDGAAQWDYLADAIDDAETLNRNRYLFDFAKRSGPWDPKVCWIREDAPVSSYWRGC